MKVVEKQGVSVSFLAFSQTVDTGRTELIDTKEAEKDLLFNTNYACWNETANMLSNNNLDNEFFERIVAMGPDAIPYILRELEKGPSMLVYALDRILPNKIVHQSYLPLPILCDLWIQYLKK